MVSYEDILYPLNLGYGLREIYDIAPWAFDLLIFALVLSAIFKPAMAKLPIFASKEAEANRLAGILALVFAGSTVYWMQVQGTNLGAAAPYLILILFAILGIFVYQLIAATEWGKKHKFISGVIAFFLTTGLCQALFGVGDIFSDVFPIFNALFVFFARILLWVVLITALILLLGRFTGKEGEGSSGGGSPSGTPPSSGGGGAGNFWKKAKEKLPRWTRLPSGKKEFDLKEYENNANDLEVQIDKASSDAKELDKLLRIQESLVKQFPTFFANLVNNITSMKQYSSRQNKLEVKMISDANKWANQVGEMVNVLTSTTPKIEKEFKKLMIDKVAIKDKFSSFDNTLSALRATPNILMHRTESDQKFFSEKDQTFLPKVAEVFQKISLLRTKAEELNVLFAKLNAEYDILNKTLPANLGEDVVKKMHNLLIGDLNSIHAELDKIITYQRNPNLFQPIDELLKLLGENTFKHFDESLKLLREAITKTANFSIALKEISTLVDKYKNNIEETDKLSKEAYALSDALDANAKAIEEKEKKEVEAKKAKEEQAKKTTGEEVAQKTKETGEKYYLDNLKELKPNLAKAQGIVGAALGIVKKKDRDKYDDVIKRFSSFAIYFKELNKIFEVDFSDASLLSNQKNLRDHISQTYQLFDVIINGLDTIKKAKNKEEYEETVLEYIQDLNKILSKQMQKDVEGMIKILNQSKPKKKK